MGLAAIGAGIAVGGGILIDRGIDTAINMANSIFKQNDIMTVSANDEDRILTFASQL